MVEPTRKMRAPKVFLTVSPVCPSVQSGLFMLSLFSLLGMSSFSLVRPTKHSVTPLPSPPKYWLPHPSPPFSLQLCAGSRAGVGVSPGPFGFPVASLMSVSTYSGLGEDGLSLGFLGRNHWTLLTISTKTELFNTHKHLKSYFVCLAMVSHYSVHKKWFWYVLKLNYSEYLLAALAWYQGVLANHQHQADQHDQEDPAIQSRHNKW